MKTKIFYFSATGNSLNLARNIAAGLGDTELISIPKVIAGTLDTSADNIGLIFPVYAWGMPRIVEEFVQKINLRPEQYIFAVAVSGGNPGGTLLQLRKMLQPKGVTLHAGFAVTEASHMLLNSKNGLISFVRSISGKMPKSGDERLPEIITIVKNNQDHKPETSAWGGTFVGNLLHGTAIQAFKQADADYWTDDKCNGCRTCEQICPRNNIKIIDGKPTWNHNCELCYACAQWCPREAIQYQKDSQGIKRSHNSQVKLPDILAR